MDNNPFFSTTPLILAASQSQIPIPSTSPLHGFSLPLIGSLSLNQPPMLSSLYYS